LTTALFIQREPRRLSAALLLSLLVHALLLSITIGGQTFGLPGLNFLWKERRLGANELQILLAPAAPPTAQAALPELIPPPTLPEPVPVIVPVKRPDVNLPIAPDAPRVRAPASSDVERDIPAPGIADDAAQKRSEQDARDRALEQARLEREKQSAEKQRQAEQAGNAQREAARQEQLRQDAARAEQTARNEAARLEAERQELARQDGLRRERAKQDEKAQQDAARQDAIKQELARQEAARQEAARQERAKLDQARQELADQEAKRDERLRAIGKQLNEEAAQRDPARSLLPTASSLRRGWLFGRADPNAELVLYAEAMSQKIEKNMTLDMVRDAVKQPHVRPIVTVAVRADGSVEKLTFVVSSGVPAIDEAIRKVVASQAPYAAFPPALARQYDVIEIRRTWVFDIAIRLE
jgi:outer membrane biosynthesis protein TonB